MKQISPRLLSGEDASLDSDLLSLLSNQRANEIFSAIVSAYLEDGEAAGSRNIAGRLKENLSPATVRFVMSDLEALGLIHAPHVSAGRMPTQKGLRFFVDSFLEISTLNRDKKTAIDQYSSTFAEANLDDLLSGLSGLVSQITKSACVIATEKHNKPIKQIEFTRLNAEQVLVIIVSRDGSVENRVINIAHDLPDAVLKEAAYWITKFAFGRNLKEAQVLIKEQINQERDAIDGLVSDLISSGIAAWSNQGAERQLIVRGQANLFSNPHLTNDLERVKSLLVDLESKEAITGLLSGVEQGQGIRVFIGSESNLYSLSGSSVIAAPFYDPEQQIMGTIGVIGPTWVNYAKVIPMVDYTRQVVNEFLAREQHHTKASVKDRNY